MTRMSRPYLLTAMILLSLLFLVFVSGPRINLDEYKPRAITLHEPLDAWIAETESQVPQLRPELRKTIMWHDPVRKDRTEIALVYLHGFSASHREIYPVMEELSEKLGANTFLARLRGHGQDGAAMGNVHYHDWLEDAEEALAIATELGNEVVLVGNSTGASLAVWLAARHPQVAAQILLSPNFGPKDKRSEMLLLPWGPTLAYQMVGEEFSFGSKGQELANIVTPRFPTKALFPMMATVSLVRNLNVREIHTPSLIFYTAKDNIVDPKLIERFYQQLGSGNKELIEVPNAKSHMLVGNYFSPETNEFVKEKIMRFMQGL